MIKLNFLELNAGSLNRIQIFVTILTILGLFHFNLVLSDLIVIILFFYLYSIVGISMMLHRFYSHRYFEFRYKFIENLFCLISILSSRGSPLGWSYMHILHHSYSDTTRDPHSPKTIGFKLFGFKYKENKEDIGKVFIVKKIMTKNQQFIHKYYFYIILSILTMVAVFINLKTVYLTWIVPIFLIQCSQNIFNFFAHNNGYRNYESNDQSKNNFFLWLLTLGDAWHNNHHGNPKAISTKVKWWEFDPVIIIINLVKK